ncbi:MAG: hypothetical protein IJ874_09410 [Ruminococcus sp.]|nr:hypothetical protein [Ruminococcus sp.]
MKRFHAKGKSVSAVIMMLLLAVIGLAAYFTPVREILAETPVSFGEDAAEEESDTLQYQQISTEMEETAVITLGGMMPEHAEVTVEKSANTAEDTVCAYDITISDVLGNDFQPEPDSPIRVEITHAAIAAYDSAQLHLWHIDDAGVREEITDFTVEGDCISFDAESFSLYELTTGDPALCTYAFYVPDADGSYSKYYYLTSTGKLMCEQIIKDSDSLIVPQLPSEIEGGDENEAGATFIGWYLMNGTDITETELDFEHPTNFTDGGTVKVGAMYAQCAYLIFHDQWNNETQSYPIVATRRGVLENGVTTIQTDDITVSYDDDSNALEEGTHMVFKGWSLEDVEPGHYPKNDDDVEDKAVVITGDLEISETTDIYPVFERIAWLNYYTGEAGTGAETLQPVSYALETPIHSLPVPTYRGYSFGGWYADEALTQQISDASGSILPSAEADTIEVQTSGNDTSIYVKKDTTLYAKWTPGNTTYTVMVWMQKVTDDVNAANADKTYTYAYSEQVPATTGANVSVGNAYKQYSGVRTFGTGDDLHTVDFTGFYYDRCDGTTEVAANGSTVLNVYYDRVKVTYQFYTNSNYTTKSESDKVGLYEQRLEEVGTGWPTDGNVRYYYEKGNAGTTTVMTYLDGFSEIDNNKKTEATYNEFGQLKTCIQKFYKSGTNNYHIYHLMQNLDEEGSYPQSDVESGWVTTNGSGSNFNLSNKFGSTPKVVERLERVRDSEL